MHARVTLHSRKRLVVLDVDGVILDSRGNMEEAWRSVCTRVGITVPFDAYFEQIGRPFAEIMATLGLSHVAGRCETVFRKASAATLDRSKFYLGIPETLHRLAAAGIKLAILTSKDRERTEIVLRRLPVDFATIQTPSTRYRGKPFPDQLIRAATLANERLQDTCYVGDMVVDEQTAKRASVDYYHAGWGYGDPPNDDCEIRDAGRPWRFSRSPPCRFVISCAAYVAGAATTLGPVAFSPMHGFGGSLKWLLDRLSPDPKPTIFSAATLST